MTAVSFAYPVRCLSGIQRQKCESPATQSSMHIAWTHRRLQTAPLICAGHNEALGALRQLPGCLVVKPAQLCVALLRVLAPPLAGRHVWRRPAHLLRQGEVMGVQSPCDDLPLIMHIWATEHTVSSKTPLHACHRMIIRHHGHTSYICAPHEEGHHYVDRHLLCCFS